MTLPLSDRELDMLKSLVLRYDPETWMVDSESPDKVVLVGSEERIATTATGYRLWYADAIVQFAHAVPRLLLNIEVAKNYDGR